MEILGIVVDTSTNLFCLSTRKLKKVARATFSLLTYSTAHERYVPLTQLRSFLRLPNSVSPAVVDWRLRLWELFNCLHHPPSPRRRLSHASLRDVNWWVSLHSDPHIGLHIWSSPSVTLHIYLSMSGWSATINYSSPTSGFLYSAHEGAHINEL